MAKNSRKNDKKRIKTPNIFKSKNRFRYNDNIEVLKKLYDMLKDNEYIKNTEYTEKDIKGAIDKIVKEQNLLYSKMNDKRFKRTRKRTLEKYKSLNDQDNKIENNKENINFVMDDKNTTNTNNNSKKINNVIDYIRFVMTKEDSTGEFVNNEPKTDLEEIVFDLDQVKISDVIETKIEPEKEKPIYRAFDSIKTKKKSIKEFEGAKVVFDGLYRVVYEGQTIFSRPINDELLDNKFVDYNENLIDTLKKFDETFNSNLCNKYRNQELEVVYDLDTFKRLKEDDYTSKCIKKIAKLDAKNNKNVTIHEKKKIDKFKASLTGIVAASIVLFSGVAVKLNSNNRNISDKTQTVTEDNTLETPNLSYSKIIDINDSKEVTTETITESTTEEKLVVAKSSTEESVKIDTSKGEDNSLTNNSNKKLDSGLEEKVETTEPKANYKNLDEDGWEIIDDEEGIKIGDTMSFDSVDLYYSSTEETPRGNTSYLDNYSYKATMVSIVYKNQILEVVNTDRISIDELEKTSKEKYGDDIQLFINYDLVDEEGNVVTQYIGWVNSNDAKSKGKVLTR